MNLLKFILLLLLNSIVVDLLAQSDTLNTVDIEAEKNLKPSDTHKTLTFSKYQTNAYALESLAGLLSKTSNIFIRKYFSFIYVLNRVYRPSKYFARFF